MRELAPDEKLSTVMVYTPTSLVRGELILKDHVRVSIWLRTQGVPNYIHLYNAHLIQLAGLPPKTHTPGEAFVPTPEVIGFHLAPPAQDPLDYDQSELNRKMELAHVLAGSFEIKSKIRVSTQTDFASSLDVMNTTWLSLYEAEISNPHVPRLKLNVPMLLVRPGRVTISLA